MTTGMSGYVLKPFRPEVLTQRIAELLAGETGDRATMGELAHALNLLRTDNTCGTCPSARTRERAAAERRHQVNERAPIDQISALTIPSLRTG